MESGFRRSEVPGTDGGKERSRGEKKKKGWETDSEQKPAWLKHAGPCAPGHKLFIIFAVVLLGIHNIAII